jgi:glucose-6-phosphate-specific signal transduction histidine kinase
MCSIILIGCSFTATKIIITSGAMSMTPIEFTLKDFLMKNKLLNHFPDLHGHIITVATGAFKINTKIVGIM